MEMANVRLNTLPTLRMVRNIALAIEHRGSVSIGFGRTLRPFSCAVHGACCYGEIAPPRQAY